MNTKFTILKAIGIFFVVYGHIGGTITFDLFSPYSFHMPLFIFISGYFYKKTSEKNFTEYSYKKVKNLLYPYFKWNLFYGLLTTLFLSFGLVYFGKKISIRSFFIDPWITGDQYIFNLAAWFVITLFTVQIVYVLIRKIIRINDYFLLIFLFLLGFAVTYLSSKGFNYGPMLILIRLFFSLPFYHLGYIYKERLEKRDKLNIWTLLTLLITQILLLQVYGNLNFVMVYGNFNGFILAPFLSSITGIWFCLQVADILNKSFSESKVMKLLGENTWEIMMHHIFFYWLIKTAFYFLGAPMDVNEFKSNIWYAYSPLGIRSMIFITIACLFLPVLTKLLFQSIKTKLSSNIK